MTLITLTCAIFKDAKDKAKNFHSCRIFAIEKVCRFLGLWCKKPKNSLNLVVNSQLATILDPAVTWPKFQQGKTGQTSPSKKR